MSNFISRIRQPVKRERAEHYLLAALLSFAGSVVLTRWFLALTGYPQLGNSTLHIAHVLWGGLLLFIAALLPLVLANREVYMLGGLLSGVGVGLFIDEVGKFITQTHDYFYPAAAPIIYAFFLLTVLLYVRVRRPPSSDARAELYRALDAMGEVLDHDLEPQEHAALESRLRRVAQQAEQPELARLAEALLDFLAADSLHLAPDEPRFWARWRARAQAWEGRWVNRFRLKIILTVGFGVMGLPAMVAVAALLLATLAPPSPQGEVVAAQVTAGTATVAADLPSLPMRLALTVAPGLPLLVASVLLALGQERRGITVGYFGLLFSLTMVNLLAFYVAQFQAITGAIIQFGMLLAAIHYRRRYLDE